MKTTEILQAIEEASQVTEKQISLLKRRLNAGEQIDLSYIWDNAPAITPEQNAKGLKYLLNLWKTPAGKERKNNPFGYREEEILTNFECFSLAGFYDAGNHGHKFYVPLYDVCGAGLCFQYYMNGGRISIVG